MKKMRKLPALLIGIMLCFALVACSENASGSDTGWKTVQNSRSEDCLTLGMTREKVEEILSTAESTEIEVNETKNEIVVTYSDSGNQSEQIQIRYVDQNVFSISVGSRSNQQDQEFSNWNLNGISLGSTKEEVIAACGTPLREETLEPPELSVQNGMDYDTYAFIDYNYDADGVLLKKDSEEAAFSLAFILKEEKVIYYSISQFPDVPDVVE